MLQPFLCSLSKSKKTHIVESVYVLSKSMKNC